MKNDDRHLRAAAHPPRPDSWDRWTGRGLATRWPLCFHSAYLRRISGLSPHRNWEGVTTGTMGPIQAPAVFGIIQGSILSSPLYPQHLSEHNTTQAKATGANKQWVEGKGRWVGAGGLTSELPSLHIVCTYTNSIVFLLKHDEHALVCTKFIICHV